MKDYIFFIHQDGTIDSCTDTEIDALIMKQKEHQMFSNNQFPSAQEFGDLTILCSKMSGLPIKCPATSLFIVRYVGDNLYGTIFHCPR